MTPPAGGGAGMVIRADVAAAAIDAACAQNPDLPLLVPTPRGAALTQDRVKRLAAGPGVMIFCPRFEGVDERLFQRRRIEEVSLGDYVLSGGDMAAQVIIDAVVRLLPGVMGGAESAAEESFENHLLEYPHYTRPAVWEDMKIPDVLTSGDHEKVSDWRRMEAEKLTKTDARTCSRNICRHKRTKKAEFGLIMSFIALLGVTNGAILC